MSLHKEIRFETEICDHLAAHRWLYAEADAAGYGRARALFPADVLAWVEATQPEAWKTLTKNHGSKASEALLGRLRDQLDQRGTLDVLRHGIELLGLRQPLKLAEFKPALAVNRDILARYEQNRLRVVRQVRYSLHNENSIDLVLFLNGIPVATVELKTDFTQSITDAVDQYRFDRNPSPKGQAPEPLLSFPRGALVHFAVSNTEVRMVTRLAGADTEFLPFNRGDDGGAGNPVNATGGHRTAYLWAEVWERESWLEILGRYLIAQRDKGRITNVIFPRYHQLDVTRKLQAAVLAERPGDLSDQDKLVYVNSVLLGKLLESPTLAQQAANNTKEQFASSPDLQSDIMNAIMSALDAHAAMSTQALNSEAIRGGIKDILLNHAQLWEALREKTGA